jgi:hypothetical protein
MSFETLLLLLTPKLKIRRHQNFISKKTSFLTITLFGNMQMEKKITLKALNLSK